MSVKCQQIVELMEQLAPKNLAEDWDNVGLLLGSPNMEVKKILLCLDVNHEVLNEAIKQGANLIISHHPLIFSPIKHLRWDNGKGQLLKELITREIGVYSAHTNLDISSRGLNHYLAKKFMLKDIEILDELNHEKLYKFIIFVPQSHIEVVKEELARNGAGWIGNYSHCSFSTEGTGSFKALENSNPYVGSVGKIEQVQEVRLETIVREKDLAKTLKSVLKVHPYEEVAYDIYPLVNKGQVQGLGVIGSLEEEIDTSEFIDMVKKKLKLTLLTGSGPMPEKIKKVALCSGAGASLISKAKFKGADVFITGDIKYHDGQIANEISLFLLDAGHFSTEIVVIELLNNYLMERIEKEKLKVEIVQSQTNRDYIQIY